MNRTLESRIRRLEKEADMSSLRHLTDDELDGISSAHFAS